MAPCTEVARGSVLNEATTISKLPGAGAAAFDVGAAGDAAGVA